MCVTYILQAGIVQDEVCIHIHTPCTHTHTTHTHHAHTHTHTPHTHTMHTHTPFTHTPRTHTPRTHTHTHHARTHAHTTHVHTHTTASFISVCYLLFTVDNIGRKRKILEFSEPPKRRKPANISDILMCVVFHLTMLGCVIDGVVQLNCWSLTLSPRPYVVYMLKDIDIHDDIESMKQVRVYGRW